MIYPVASSHCKPSLIGARFSFLVGVAAMLIPVALFAQAPETDSRSVAPSRLNDPIDEHSLVMLKGNVRKDLAAVRDLGQVEDEMPLHLYLLLKRSAAQQSDLDNLLARQQQPTAPEYHKWLTPKQFGARFGASPEDIAKLSTWLESHGFQVRSVLNNASMIDFASTAGQVREAFHTELHYFNIRGGKHAAIAQDPQIPAALAPVVAGIKGLSKIPALTNHTRMRQSAYDAGARRWQPVDRPAADLASPADNAGGGYYLVTPQDLYTIYDINPTFSGGELAAKATVAVIEESDIEYGTVGAGGVATGGDVATFRTLFGVPGTLNMHVYHGYGTVTCNAPGIDPDGIGEDEEASLDAEWINATAPSANEIFMSCDQSPDNGIFSSMAALIDNNLADAMSLSYGETELAYGSGDYTAQDTLYAQAALQGQSIFISSGDSGSDSADQNTSGTATSGINVSAFAAPTVTVAGGTDFSDLYDAFEGGPTQSTYWAASNTAHYGNALSYIPETAWNDSCASSILAALEGFTGAGFCGSPMALDDGYVDAAVVGGSGGFSTHYTVPAWQTGISGYAGSFHSLPDIAGFAASGFWGHYLIFCDSHVAGIGCTSASTFGGAGGTSFVAPYMAGVAGLLVDSTGARQGLLNPALYALAKAQFSAPATATACYSNGQASNSGVTTGLPASTCIFNDVTTSNNDVPCAAGSTSCYIDSGQSYGMLSLTGSSSLSVAFPSTPGFDQVTGIGTVNVQNLLTNWNTAFTSTTALSASPTSILPSQSTLLTATVTGGTPTGYLDTPPALSGTASFSAGATSLGNCTLSGGTCSLSVPGTALQQGANSVTATFTGSGTYPASTSSIVTVTLTTGTPTPATMISPAQGSTLRTSNVMFTWTTGTGVTSYTLWLGTSGPGSSSLYSSGATAATSATVPIVPAKGVTVYARLYSVIGGVPHFNDYTYTEAAPPATTPATMIAPTTGSTLGTSGVMFAWTAGTGVTSYTLWLGTSGPGSSSLYSSGSTVATSATVPSVPAKGATVYARLYSVIGGVPYYNDYTYTETAPPATTPATMTSPTTGSTLGTSNVMFTWAAGTGVTSYILWLGTSGPGSSSLYSSGSTTATFVNVPSIPGKGVTVYARLFSVIGGMQQHNDYIYTEAGPPTTTPATMISPTAGSTLGTSNVMFTWTAGTGVTRYTLWLGTSGPGSSSLYSSGSTIATSATVPSLPARGVTVYARLFSVINGANQFNDYTYTEQ